MQRKSAAFGEIYDVYAIRLLVDEVRDCYAASALCTASGSRSPASSTTNIAVPKPTATKASTRAVIALDGKPLEIQIRTHAMHSVSEVGSRPLALQGGLQGRARLRPKLPGCAS